MRLPVRQSFAFATANCKDRTFSIGNLSGVIPELKFGQIAVQIFLGAVLVNALHAALKPNTLVIAGMSLRAPRIIAFLLRDRKPARIGGQLADDLTPVRLRRMHPASF